MVLKEFIRPQSNITQLPQIFYNVSAMIYQPGCTSSSFLLSRNFPIQCSKNGRKYSDAYYYFLLKMPNYSNLLAFLNTKISFSI